jgi:hypothetical protein
VGVAAAVAGATQGRLDDPYGGGSARGVVLVNSGVTITRSDVRSGNGDNGGNGGAGAAGGNGSNGMQAAGDRVSRWCW